MPAVLRALAYGASPAFLFRLVLVIILISPSTYIVFATAQETTQQDFYASLDQLKKNEVDGTAYKIEKVARPGGAVVVSPHGGYIETGTSELAAMIAGQQYSLFDFEALKPANSWKLHVTATHFVDAELDRMLAENKVCITVHGRRGTDSVAWLGGLNLDLKKLIATNLQNYQIDSLIDPPRIAGVSVKNMVNKTSLKGVQLELPAALRDNAHQRQAVASAVREALQSYLQAQK